MALANRRSQRLKGRRLRNWIESRRLTQARKTEDAWEAENAAPVRDEANGGFPVLGWKHLRQRIALKWPTRNKTKRGFMVFGITKSMLSRSRRKLNDLVVAD